MQWFAEYILAGQWRGKLPMGVPGKDVLGGMTEKRQPDLGDRRAYSNPRLHTTATEDRASGRVAADPQTALERSDQEGRLARERRASKDPEGEKEYRQYEAFLNSAYLNLAAGDIHDYFNRTGVTVTNAADQQFVVGGDGHMLRIQSEDGDAGGAPGEHTGRPGDLRHPGDGRHLGESRGGHLQAFPDEGRPRREPEPVGLEPWNDTFVSTTASSTSSRTWPRTGSTRSSERGAASSSTTGRSSRRRIPEAVPMVGGEAGAIPAIARRDAHDADIAEDAVREPFVRCCAAIGARIPRAVIT